MSVKKRQALERRMVRHLIRSARKAGYRLAFVWDGGERVKVRTEAEAMDAVFSVDESRIYFKHPEEGKAHCACIVLGNSGWDAIADASMGDRWDAVMEDCSEYSEKLEGQA